jgi:hypothetical protein
MMNVENESRDYRACMEDASWHVPRLRARADHRRWLLLLTRKLGTQ